MSSFGSLLVLMLVATIRTNWHARHLFVDSDPITVAGGSTVFSADLEDAKTTPLFNSKTVTLTLSTDRQSGELSTQPDGIPNDGGDTTAGDDSDPRDTKTTHSLVSKSVTFTPSNETQSGEYTQSDGIPNYGGDAIDGENSEVIDSYQGDTKTTQSLVSKSVTLTPSNESQSGELSTQSDGIPNDGGDANAGENYEVDSYSPGDTKITQSLVSKSVTLTPWTERQSGELSNGPDGIPNEAGDANAGDNKHNSKIDSDGNGASAAITIVAIVCLICICLTGGSYILFRGMKNEFKVWKIV